MEPHSNEAVHSIGDSQSYKKSFSSTPSKERAQSCGKCGHFHAREACPAMVKTCRKCGKANHFARMCKTGSKEKHEVSEASLQTDDSLFVETISGDIRSSNKVFVDIEVGQYNEAVRFKHDPGAQVNVIPLDSLN